MEKKQKIAMKKLQFFLVIAPGSNCRGVLIRGQCHSLRWELSGGIVQGAIVLGENWPGAIVPRGSCPGGNCPGGNVQGELSSLLNVNSLEMI